MTYIGNNYYIYNFILSKVAGTKTTRKVQINSKQTLEHSQFEELLLLSSLLFIITIIVIIKVLLKTPQTSKSKQYFERHQN